MDIRPYTIQNYLRDDETCPFEDWLNNLRDRQARAKIKARLRRITLGNFGDYKPVGEGVYELRLHAGPGYRIYFAQIEETIVLLLCGGDKSSQHQDIQLAKRYRADYEERKDSSE
jgi:putative addiction module killer protein